MSVIPFVKGASGPTITKSIEFSLQVLRTKSLSSMSPGIQVAIFSMPGLPGMQ